MLGRKLLHYIAGKELKKKFGGRVRFFGVGGAKLDWETERFLSEAKFPYSIGYGMTEASPLLAGAPPSKTKLYSTGPTVINQELQIVNPNPKTGIGEIWARGRNVMAGYYKQPEKTSEVLKDGWFYTGDYGYINDKDQLLITGRKKNVIVLSNGKNIYPEEMEGYIQGIEYVSEVVVRSQRNAKGEESSLVAELFLTEEHTNDEVLKDIRKVTAELPVYKQISNVIIRETEFNKTTSRKIKR